MQSFILASQSPRRHMLLTWADIPFEVIVSDNDPECSGRYFVESLNDSRFIYSPNGTNLGMKASFNKSLNLSSGQFIVMIADDDPVYVDMLETLVKLSIEHPGYGMYMGGCDWFAKDKEAAAAALNKTDMEYKILEKIKFQWKTLRKAFMDLNIDKSGNISKKELWYYLDFWGMKISQEEFEKVYASFDVDGDGVINYKDF